MTSILDQIKEQVNSLSADEVRSQLLKMQEQKAKQRERQAAKELSPEQLEKRKAYNRERIQRPEVKEKMKAYHAKPEVKERMKEYRQKRALKLKAIVARAAELGITAATVGESPNP
jgi:ferric-dicitrate binding protein FerR (iron transport regulator)